MKALLFLSIAAIAITNTATAAASSSEEHLTVTINSSANNLTAQLYRDAKIENHVLIVEDNGKEISNISVYHAFNIHSMEGGKFRLSISRRSNGLLELLSCEKKNKRSSSDAKPTKQSDFGKIYTKIEELIQDHPGFGFKVNASAGVSSNFDDSYDCTGLMLAPDKLNWLKEQVGALIKPFLDSFTSRIQHSKVVHMWDFQFNLRIVSTNNSIDGVSLYFVLNADQKRLKINVQNMTQLLFSTHNKEAIFQVVANLTNPHSEFIERGTYLFSPLTYHSGEQYFDGTGLHPKFTRNLAISLSARDVWTQFKSDDSCLLIVQETLDKGNYIDIDEVRNDGNMSFDTFGVIDIEKPSSESPQHTYFIRFFRNSSYISVDEAQETIWINFTTPYHFRYQPASSQEYTPVEVWEASQLYISCKGYKHFLMDEYNRMESGYLELLEQKYGRKFVLISNTNNDDHIIAIYNIPSGEIENRDLVTYSTLAIGGTVCIILILIILNQKNISKSKKE